MLGRMQASLWRGEPSRQRRPSLSLVPPTPLPSLPPLPCKPLCVAEAPVLRLTHSQLLPRLRSSSAPRQPSGLHLCRVSSFPQHTAATPSVMSVLVIPLVCTFAAVLSAWSPSAAGAVFIRLSRSGLSRPWHSVMHVYLPCACCLGSLMLGLCQDSCFPQCMHTGRPSSCRVGSGPGRITKVQAGSGLRVTLNLDPQLGALCTCLWTSALAQLQQPAAVLCVQDVPGHTPGSTGPGAAGAPASASSPGLWPGSCKHALQWRPGPAAA